MWRVHQEEAAGHQTCSSVLEAAELTEEITARVRALLGGSAREYAGSSCGRGGFARSLSSCISGIGPAPKASANRLLVLPSRTRAVGPVWDSNLRARIVDAVDPVKAGGVWLTGAARGASRCD